MLQKILLFASPIVSAATIATVITVNSWKKKKPPHIKSHGMMMTMMIILVVQVKDHIGGILNKI